jgi:ubiquinone/menaquinone biosynthesis C-methylase UbiE
MIKIAREKLPKVEFKLMDMRQLDYPVDYFDGILAAYSLIHIASQEIPETLKGFYRVLKPNGLFGIIAQKGKADQVVNEPLKAGEKMFFNFFTKERLGKFLTEAGFKLKYQEEAVLDDEEGSLSNRVIYTIARK